MSTRHSPKREWRSLSTVDMWKQKNPDHCPECFCRPGMGDSDQGTDHESFCTVVER